MHFLSANFTDGHIKNKLHYFLRSQQRMWRCRQSDIDPPWPPKHPLIAFSSTSHLTFVAIHRNDAVIFIIFGTVTLIAAETTKVSCWQSALIRLCPRLLFLAHVKTQRSGSINIHSISAHYRGCKWKRRLLLLSVCFCIMVTKKGRCEIVYSTRRCCRPCLVCRVVLTRELPCHMEQNKIKCIMFCKISVFFQNEQQEIWLNSLK